MRAPIPVAVGLAVLREIARAIAFPFHLLAYLPRREAWRQRARESLAAAARSYDGARADADADAGDAPLAEFLRAHPPRGDRRGHVFVSCGETSGETHAVHLVAALRAAVTGAAGPAPRITAFGGARLAAAGVEVLFPLAEHAVMGLASVFRAIPTICRAYARYLRLLRDDPPALIVLIDNPGFHLVMARAARRHDIPVVHYVAPQYWGWGPWRMQRYRRAVDATLTILPFEPAFFAATGVASEYVGHPLLDEIDQHAGGGRTSADSATSTTAVPVGGPPRLVVMPGSRRKDLTLHLSGMVRVGRRLREAHGDLQIVLPHRNERRRPLIEQLLREAGAGDLVDVRVGDPKAWLDGARVALVKSGTGSLEACLLGVPTVVVYAAPGPVSRWFLHNMVTVPWFAAANLCMGRAVVPEVAIERDAQWDDVYDHLLALFQGGEAREQCLRGLAALRTRLGEPGASRRAARWLVPFGTPAAAADAERAGAPPPDTAPTPGPTTDPATPSNPSRPTNVKTEGP